MPHNKPQLPTIFCEPHASTVACCEDDERCLKAAVLDLPIGECRYINVDISETPPWIPTVSEGRAQASHRGRPARQRLYATQAGSPSLLCDVCERPLRGHPIGNGSHNQFRTT